ncbi:MAG: hypothetical protein HQ565_07680 [Bacteroidetes bacterium]|nr:hypothetical protein [Bacteroidota bacterium]
MQLVLIREFLNLFMGNELVIGIILALWMILTASGAIAGRYLHRPGRNEASLLILLVLNGVLPLAGAIFAVWLRSILYVPGSMLSLQGILIISLAGLAAFCFFSGMMFTILAATLSENSGKSSISRIYALEALGSLAGGIVFNFILVYSLNSLRILIIVMMLNLLAAVWFAFVFKNKMVGISCLLLSLALLLPILFINPDSVTAKMLYPGQEVLLNRDTPFGKIVLTENKGQYNFYSSGVLYASSWDIAKKEEKVHYAMALHPAPADVLMLSGGWDGALQEVLKYPVSRVDYVDPNPWLLKAAASYLWIEWPENVNIRYTDPRRFLQETPHKYDVILLNTGPPNTVGNNRFYTREFFRKAKTSLHPGGIISLNLASAGNYLNEDTRLLYSNIYNTLKNTFLHIRLIPGGRSYFIASDEPLNGDITALIQQKNIPTEYVNAWYLDMRSMDERAEMILNELDPDARINEDFYPLAAYLSLRQWLGMFHIQGWLIALIPLLLMTLILLRMKPISLGLFASGFTASSAEFMLLIGFQVIYGFIYQMAGLIIMAFMAGLAAGSGYLHKYFRKEARTFIRIQLGIGIMAGITPFIMMAIDHPGFPAWLPGLIITLLTFMFAVLTGIQYQLATRLRDGTAPEVASSTYSADLLGSAFGVFLVAVFIFPLIGMVFTGLLLAGLNFVAAGVVRWRL